MNHMARDQKKKEIVEEFLKGTSVSKICGKYEVQKSSVYNYVKASRMVRDGIESESLSDKDAIVRMALKGTPVKTIVHDFHLKQSTVYYWIDKYRDEVMNSEPRLRNQKGGNSERLRQTILILKKTSITVNMSLKEIIELIQGMSACHPVHLLCEAFDISPSTYYSYLKKRIPSHVKRDEMLKIRIKEIFLRHKKRIGGVKIREALRLEGQRVSLTKVFRLMKDLQIRMRTPKAKAAYLVHHKNTDRNCVNLLGQEFDQREPDRVWVSDITEVKILGKPVYLCVILDLFARKVIAHRVSRKNNTRLTLATLDQAIRSRKAKPGMFHSDRGSQYSSQEFREHLQELEIPQSFNAPGYPFDNAVMESFFSCFKKETLYRMPPFTVIQRFKEMVEEYITYYNSVRFHGANGMLTPNDKEEIHRKMNLTVKARTRVVRINT